MLVRLTLTRLKPEVASDRTGLYQRGPIYEIFHYHPWANLGQILKITAPKTLVPVYQLYDAFEGVLQIASKRPDGLTHMRWPHSAQLPDCHPGSPAVVLPI